MNSHEVGRLTSHPCCRSSSMWTGRSHCRTSPCRPPPRWPWWTGPGSRWWTRPTCRSSPGWAGWGRTRRSPPARGGRSAAAMPAWRWSAGPRSGCSDSSDSETGTSLTWRRTTAEHLEWMNKMSLDEKNKIKKWKSTSNHNMFSHRNRVWVAALGAAISEISCSSIFYQGVWHD